MKAVKDQAKYENIGTALSFLDKFLEGENYVAGKNMTLADLSIVSTVSTLEVNNRYLIEIFFLFAMFEQDLSRFLILLQVRYYVKYRNIFISI